MLLGLTHLAARGIESCGWRESEEVLLGPLLSAAEAELQCELHLPVAADQTAAHQLCVPQTKVHEDNNHSY